MLNYILLENTRIPDNQLKTTDCLILAHKRSCMLTSSQRDARSVSCPHDRQRNRRAKCIPKLAHGEPKGHLAQEEVPIISQRQQDEVTQPSCPGFFTSNCSFPLLAGWPRNVSCIAASVSGSPTRFLPTVLSRNADFTKSLPQPSSVEHGRGPLGKMASGLKRF